MNKQLFDRAIANQRIYDDAFWQAWHRGIALGCAAEFGTVAFVIGFYWLVLT